MILYNLFPLLAGRFSQWTPHLARAGEMGFDWVFLNPVQKLGASQSLYSIADYFALNPVLLDPAGAGSPDGQVRGMIRQAKQAGLKVMIDLVINHCAIDSALTREHPDWFVREPGGAIVHPSCQQNGQTVVWQDLALFDHRQTRDPEGLFHYCERVVEHLISLGFEGFRCDAAYQIPADFWRRLLGEIKSRHPQICFAAETLGCTAEQTRETARAGFDYVFNSSKWWNFSDGWLLEEYNLVREAARSIGFPESHDTPRLAEELNGNVNGLKQRYLFSALFSAGVMIPLGFEFGLRRPLSVVGTTPADWTPSGVDLCRFIGQVNALKKRQPVFQEESPTDILPCSNPNILLMRKRSRRDGKESLLILNKDIGNHQEFATDRFQPFLPSGAPLRDVSPEYPLERVSEPFHYALRPGQGIVLVSADS